MRFMAITMLTSRNWGEYRFTGEKIITDTVGVAMTNISIYTEQQFESRLTN